MLYAFIAHLQPAAIDGFEVNFIGGHGQPFDADIAAEQTYRKGIPNRRLNQNNNVMGKASSSHKFDAPKALKSKVKIYLPLEQLLAMPLVSHGPRAYS